MKFPSLFLLTIPLLAFATAQAHELVDGVVVSTDPRKAAAIEQHAHEIQSRQQGNAKPMEMDHAMMKECMAKGCMAKHHKTKHIHSKQGKTPAASAK